MQKYLAPLKIQIYTQLGREDGDSWLASRNNYMPKFKPLQILAFLYSRENKFASQPRARLQRDKKLLFGPEIKDI